MRHGGKKAKKNLRKYFPEKKHQFRTSSISSFSLLTPHSAALETTRARSARLRILDAAPPQKSPTEALLQLKQFEQKHP